MKEGYDKSTAEQPKEPTGPKEPKESETVMEATKSLASMTIHETSIEEQIAEIEAWLKGEGRLKFKEQPKKMKELIRLKGALKMKK
jgi:hypothetical protein